MGKRSFLLIAVLLLCHSIGFAQRWRSGVELVKQEGYYVIVVSPEVLGSARRSSDCGGVMRLQDRSGDDVPFFQECERLPDLSTSFQPFEVLDRRGDGPTRITFTPNGNGALEEVVLNVRNASINKHVSVSGSDDERTWFFIKQVDVWIGEDEETYVYRSIDLPKSSYRYYRLALDDTLGGPVQVNAVGAWKRDLPRARYTRVKYHQLQRKEEGSRTILTVANDVPIGADRWWFDVKGSAPFDRRGTFYKHVRARPDPNHKGRILPAYDEVLGTFRLSDKQTTIDLPRYFSDTLQFAIENHDDAPLEFNDVYASLLETRLIAKLDATEPYTVLIGDSVTMPHFDLERVRDRIPAPLDTLRMGEMALDATVTPTGALFDPSKWWVWAAIIGLMAMMGVLAARLLKKV